MNVDERVAAHYGRDGEAIDTILDAIEAAGGDRDRPTTLDLAGVDEFHLGGRAASLAAIEPLRTIDANRVLDVGCGIGGPARTIATELDVDVVGVDLTPSFVDAARTLSGLVGLGERTTFEVGNATDLRFDDARFDAATLFHVGMNIEAKAPLMAELARVVRPDGVVIVYDVMRIGDGDLTFPVPWAAAESTSFVDSPQQYVDAMRAAGIEPSDPIDRRPLLAEVMAKPPVAPTLDLSHLMGDSFATMFANLGAAIRGGSLAPVQIVGRVGGS